MKSKVYRKLLSAVCALALLLSLAPAAYGAEAGQLTVEDAMLAQPTFSASAAIKTDGSLWSWEGNWDTFWSTGSGTPARIDRGTSTAVTNYARVDENGGLWVWGFKENFVDGNPFVPSNDLTVLKSMTKIMDGVQYAAIDEIFSLALKTDGSVWMWGMTGANTDCLPASQAVREMDGVKQIQNCYESWYALKTDGTLWRCAPAKEPQKVMDGTAAFSASGDGYNVLVIKTDGSLWGWGDNATCQLGQGKESGTVDAASAVKIMDSAACAYTNGSASFAVTPGGELYGWGRNGSGELGFSGGDITCGIVRCQSTPKKLMDGVAAIRGGNVLKRDGSLWINYTEADGCLGSFRKVLDGVKLPGGKGGAAAAPETPDAPETPTAPETPDVPPVSAGGAAYSKRGTTLGPRPGGGYELIWTSGSLYVNQDGSQTDTRKTQIVFYDANFRETNIRPVTKELDELEGAYWGANYNFLVFSQSNQEETDSKEVLRVVKFSKEWERLGAASVYGKSSNTSTPVAFGNLSFAEAGDMLYVHTSHEMYRTNDGLQHQANMTFSIRQTDMTITDSRHNISNQNTGYVSHSFAQDILVDQSGHLVTLDLGDAYPRGALLFRYGTKAGGNKFAGIGTDVVLAKWSGESGSNNVGALTTALAETSQGYLSAYLDSGKGEQYGVGDHYDVYLAFTPKDNFSKSQIRKVASGTSTEFPKLAYLFPTGPEGGWLLWFTSNKQGWALEADHKAYYATYSSDGTVGKITSLGAVPSPLNGPYYDGERIIWSSSADEYAGMEFCTLDASGITVTKADGALAGKAPSTPSTPTNPTTPTTPNTTGNPFTDVPANAYYTDAVLWALEKKITTGATATTFEPDSTCNRAQVATFLWRAKGEPEPTIKTNPFVDNAPSTPYYKAILWAYENGIITGTSATTFDPYDPCTNGHVVTMLWRAEGKPAASGTSALANAFPKDFYTDAVAWADTTGLLENTGAAFNPTSQSPRSNIVTYLYRNLAE